MEFEIIHKFIREIQYFIMDRDSGLKLAIRSSKHLMSCSM